MTPFTYFICLQKLNITTHLSVTGITMLSNYRSLSLSKDITLFCFYKSPALVPVFTDRNPKMVFALKKQNKRWKAKTAFSACFAVNCYTGSVHLEQWKWHHQAPSLRTTLSISASHPHIFQLSVSICALFLFILCIH